MAIGDDVVAVTASVIFLTYNHGRFVEEAFQSLLKQDHPNLEIIIADDASTDDTWDRIVRMVSTYAGPKKIFLQRNEKNLGLCENYNQAFLKTTGEVIFSAAGDDVSLTTRCSESIGFWLAQGKKPDLIASDTFDMDVGGHIHGDKRIDELSLWTIEKWAQRRPHHFGASHMLTRRLLDVGPMNPGAPAEDQIFLFRAILLGGACRLPHSLVKHRRGGMSAKASRLDYDQKKARLLHSAAGAVAEMIQLIEDWRQLRPGEPVPEFLTSPLQHARYVVQMLGPRQDRSLLGTLMDYRDVPLRKRARCFLLQTLPWIYRPVFWLGASLKR